MRIMVKAAVKEKIHPLWILFSSRWGGPEQVAIADMVEMAGADYPIHLLCYDGSPVHAAALRYPKIQVRAITTHPLGRFDWSFARLLRHLIDEVDANIVHINDEYLLWHLIPAL